MLYEVITIRDISWKAQTRLCGRYRRLLARGKSKQTVVTAIARELGGFIWAIDKEPADPPVTMRVETPPGYEAQVDFGEVGKLTDSSVITSYSIHYTKLYDQCLETLPANGGSLRIYMQRCTIQR